MKHTLPALVLPALALPALLLLGCKSEPTAPPAEYTVRGVVKDLPSAEALNTFLIHHEAIPEFVNRQGKKAGMLSMSMPFGATPGLNIEGIAPGDKVEFTFAVEWDKNPSGQIKSMRELPADTQLQLAGY